MWVLWGGEHRSFTILIDSNRGCDVRCDASALDVDVMFRFVARAGVVGSTSNANELGGAVVHTELLNRGETD